MIIHFVKLQDEQREALPPISGFFTTNGMIILVLVIKRVMVFSDKYRLWKKSTSSFIIKKIPPIGGIQENKKCITIKDNKNQQSTLVVSALNVLNREIMKNALIGEGIFLLN